MLVSFVLPINRHSSVTAWVLFYSPRRWCVCTADSDKAGRMDGAALLNTVQIYRKENADMAEETKQTPKLELIRASEIDPKSVDWLWYPFIPYGIISQFAVGKLWHKYVKLYKSGEHPNVIKFDLFG